MTESTNKYNETEIRQVSSYSIVPAAESDTIHLIGYACLFDTPASDLFVQMHGFSEVISRNAFDNCNLDNVVALINHNDNLLLGRSPKTLQLVKDERGLKFDIALPNTTYAKDLVALLDRQGDIGGCSFQFVKEKDSWNKRNGLAVRKVDNIRRLLDISVITTFPAYDDTSVAKRSLQEIEEVDLEQIETQIQKQKALDVLRKKLGLQVEYIKAIRNK